MSMWFEVDIYRFGKHFPAPFQQHGRKSCPPEESRPEPKCGPKVEPQSDQSNLFLRPESWQTLLDSPESEPRWKHQSLVISTPSPGANEELIFTQNGT